MSRKKSIKDTISSIKGIIKGDNQIQSLELLLESLIEYAKDDPIIKEGLTNFRESETWSRTVKLFNEKMEQEKDDKITLKSGAKERLSDLFLNQMDSRGIFYYEPNTCLSNQDHDLSYIIQLDDMITLKIKEDMRESGALNNFLRKKRVISLSENFSDRLLNIMGNFFSKIGTPDVNQSAILELYAKSFPNSFILPSK